MKVVVNGKEMTVAEELPLDRLLADLNFAGSYFAVAVNLRIVPRGEYSRTKLREQDAVEILSPMQGG